MKRAALGGLLLVGALSAWAGGSGEAAAATTNRAEYLAERGTVIPRHEIRIDSLIAGVDYAYPQPQGPFGVSVYTGHQQVSAAGQSELVMIGVQGKRGSFEDLPPLNLALVVDASASMGEPDGLPWVKESLAILLDTVRNKDSVALVAFDDRARLLVPSVRLGTPGARERLLAEVGGLAAAAGSNIEEGLALGFRELMSRFDPGQVNRLMLLTDGWGDARGVARIVREHREQGVEVSVIGYGAHFDTRFADQLVAMGGGSSRFISDRSRMQEVFGSGLARSTVPVARDVRLRVSLKEGRALATWGYEHVFASDRRSVSYRIPAVHFGDYETMLLAIQLPPSTSLGVRPAVVVEGSYRDLQGEERELQAVQADLDFVADSNPVAGFSDARVLKAGSMLGYAFALTQISDDYYHAPLLYETFFRAYGTLNELRNARLRLGDASFDEPIEVLSRYGSILGAEIGLRKAIVEQILGDDELKVTDAERPLMTRLGYLFQELLLRLGEAPPGAIAVSGFRLSGDRHGALAELINQAGAERLSALAAPGFSVVERERLDAVLHEQELALSDLADPGNAVRVGRLLTARYLVTGSVIPAADSVLVFGRIINVETAVIESAAQVVIPRSAEIDSLL